MTGSDGVYGGDMEALTDEELEAALDASADPVPGPHPMQSFLAASTHALASVDLPAPTPELAEFMSGSGKSAAGVLSGAGLGQVISLDGQRDRRLTLVPARHSMRLLAGAAAILGVVGLAQLTGTVDLFSSETAAIEVATQPDGSGEAADEGFEVAADDAGSVRLFVEAGQLQAGAIAFGAGWTPEDLSAADGIEVVFRNELGDVVTLEAELEADLVVVTVADLVSGDQSTSYFTIDGAVASAPGDAIVVDQPETDDIDSQAVDASIADQSTEAGAPEPNTNLETSQSEQTESTIVDDQSPKAGGDTQDDESTEISDEPANDDAGQGDDVSNDDLGESEDTPDDAEGSSDGSDDVDEPDDGSEDGEDESDDGSEDGEDDSDDGSEDGEDESHDDE